MAIPTRVKLNDELHCLSHNGLIVITAQRWSDPQAEADRPRHWMRLVRNGRQCDVRQFTGPTAYRRLGQIWNQLAEQYQPTALTEDQMWAKLRELTGIEPTQCLRTGCAGQMPVAWTVCPQCGRDARKVASGSMSGAYRRGIIVTTAPPAP